MPTLNESTLRELVDLRQELHRTAELSGSEHRTAALLKERLSDYGPDRITGGIGGEGVIASFEGDKEGPAVMIRCELDALPIPDEIEVSYRSESDGVAHKCGHDGHMAIVAGVARQLGVQRPARGSVHLLFQPAEETGRGAARVMEDENFRAYEPDYIFALHNLPGVPAHRVVVRDGVFSAASRGLEAALRGETSHAAHPENGVSPAPALAQLITVFSSFPQYYGSLDEAVKATVIQANLGEVAFGTSPGYAEFRATLRTYDNARLEAFCQRAEEMVESVARTYGLEAETAWNEPFDATVNDTTCNALIEKAADSAHIETTRKESPFAWSEDFGRFTSAYRGAMFGLGAGEEHPQLHSSHYDFPDEIIETGITVFTGIIDQILGLKQRSDND